MRCDWRAQAANGFSRHEKENADVHRTLRTLYRAEESRMTSMKPKTRKKVAATMAGRRQTMTMIRVINIVVMNMMAVSVTPAYRMPQQ